MNKNKKRILATLIMCLCVALCGVNGVSASGNFSVSPMNQKIVLNAGESYVGSFKLTNPADSGGVFNYKLTLGPFAVDNNYNVSFENNGDYNKILGWTTLEKSEGFIAPNTVEEVRFKIDIPVDAPAGGQYMAITVSANEDPRNDGNINIQSRLSIAHIVYAEIAGTTVRKGEILNSRIPGFIFSGNIAGTSVVKNEGNVHSDAYYTLQVFPLFSDEELYTNEEKAKSKIILPDTTRTNSLAWEETPSVGMFKVIFTTEFEGVIQQVEKYVIVCPLWLLFVIIVALILIVAKIVSKTRKRSKEE